jgi:peptidoglycan/xylan/chitin deacetylase (PgdA/CDA1 family)
MLRRIKLAALRTSNWVGLTSWLSKSEWRRRRLLILCYHGTSIEDEHEWDGALYMPQELLRSRLEMIRRSGANVLPLDEALQFLAKDKLPARSLVITYDDGAHDFYSRAYPVLSEYGWPVTVYVTTYYSEYNRPVFDVVVDYILWKSKGARLEWPEVLGAGAVELSASSRPEVTNRILQFARDHKLSARDKDSLAEDLAGRVGVDYGHILERRLLHIMPPAELAAVAKGGVSLELHTHRHRVSMNGELFQREIADNRLRVDPLRGSASRHFCYPAGVHRPEFAKWLMAGGVVSAATCEVGLNSAQTDPYSLRRLVDTSSLTPLEFRAWLSGVASLLPHRPYQEGSGQFLD